MVVVGAWGAVGRDLANAILPRHTPRLDAEGGVLFGSHLGDRVAVVGQAPTLSTISLKPWGLVLDRGAAWTAPIYYREDFRIASSNLGLLVRREDAIDFSRLAASIGYAVRRDESRTCYRKIRLVRPFETVVLSKEQTSTRREPPSVAVVGRASNDDLAMELRRLLFAAVERAAAGRRVAVMLSGGMDSSSVLAALLATRGVKASEILEVTLDFDAPGSDRPHVSALERHYGISVARIRPAEAPAREAMVLDGAPSRHHGDPWVIACARKAHAMGAEVLMTGTGGDQFFGGDLGTAATCGIHQHDLLGTWDALRAEFPHRASVRHRARSLVAALLRPYVPQRLRRLRANRVLRGIPNWAGPVLREELERALTERTLRAAGHPHDPQTRYDDAVRNPADSEYGAEARAQTDMVSPIPRVDPLYDEELVQFLLAVGQQALFADGSYRGLLRRAMRGLLPESVRTRVDKSDFEPALTEALWPLDDLEPLLSFESIGDAGIVNTERFRSYLAPLYDAPREGVNGSRWLAFWPAIAAEAFLRR